MSTALWWLSGWMGMSLMGGVVWACFGLWASKRRAAERRIVIRDLEAYEREYARRMRTMTMTRVSEHGYRLQPPEKRAY